MREQDSFGTSVWLKWVLDAIKKIRAQKQRPSVERICNAVRQHHNHPDSTIIERLERLVTDGLILKVFNKGQSTYKDPGGVQSRRVAVTGDSDLTKLVVKAVRELNDRDGSALKSIEKYIRQSNSLDIAPGLDFTAVLKTTLKRASERGSVIQDGKFYKPLDRPDSYEKTPKTPKRTTEDGISPSKKRKRISSICLEESPKKSGLPICSECLGTASKNKSGEAEELSACSECGVCVHPSCLGKARGELLVILLARGTTWRCEDCVTCAKCTTNAEQVCVLNCESCDSSYHLGCLEPAVDRKGKAAWKCQACLDEPGRALVHHHVPHSAPTPRVNQRNLRVAHLRSLRKAARANLNWRKGKQRSGSAESSSEDAATINSIISSDLPPGVTQKDLDAFKHARERSHAVTKKSTETDQVINIGPPQPPRCPSSIEFGQYLIQTWYSSPFPQELGKLFLCEFCLKYTKSKVVLQRHLDKCNWRHPPGTEIYRHNDLSVFEVDGNVTKFYCQNLCLLAKLFLDHKTLYYDVEPFLFYVLTKNDDKGFHLVGYFSKEKHCQQKYNVSCIMTLPQYQRQGYGRFLIDFSYLLSKEEGLAGTPEKPLSDLGRVSYNAYWRSVLLEYFNKHRDGDMTLMQISKETGLHVNDIAATLQNMNMLRVWSRDGERGCGIAIVVDWPTVDSHIGRVMASRSRIPIEPECLRWTPLISNLTNQFKAPEEEGEEDDEEEEEEEEEDIKEEEKPIPTLEKKVVTSERLAEKRKAREKAEKLDESSEEVQEPPVLKINKPKLSETPSPLVKEKTRKQRLIPELLRKQQEKANQIEAEKPLKKEEPATPEPLPEKRKRGPKKKWEDESVEEVVERKRRKTSDTPIIKPSRLRLPAEPPKSEPPPQKGQPWIVRSGRITAGNRLSLRTPKVAKPPKTPASAPTFINKRAIAARARWARARAEKEEILRQQKQEEERKDKNEKMPELQAEEPIFEKDRSVREEAGEPPTLATADVPLGSKDPADTTEPPKRKRGWVKGVARRGYKPKKKIVKRPKFRKMSRAFKKKKQVSRSVENKPETEGEEVESISEEKEEVCEEKMEEDQKELPMKSDEEKEESNETEIEKSPQRPPSSNSVESNSESIDHKTPSPSPTTDENDRVEETKKDEPLHSSPVSNDIEVDKQDTKNDKEDLSKNPVPEESSEKEETAENKFERNEEPVTTIIDSSDEQGKDEIFSEKPKENNNEDKFINTVEGKNKEERKIEEEKPKVLPMEVDLTLGDDSQSPPKSVIQESQKAEEIHKEEPPEPVVVQKHHDKSKEKSVSHKACETRVKEDPNEKRFSPLVKEKKEVDKKSPPTIVILDDSDKKREEKHGEVEVLSGNSTPRMDSDISMNPGSVKQAEIPSMGVYTPDSTTNSVHSLHSYGQCDLDVSQLGLESPASISSNEMPPSEQVRPPSTVAQCYTDCAQQAAAHLHHHTMHQYQQAVKSRSSKAQHGGRNRSNPQPASPGPPHYPHHHAQGNYIVPQAGTYVGVPAVLQHRMTQQGPPQRIPPSPSCSVSTSNFYIQTAVHSQGGQPSSSLAKLQQLTNGLETLPPGHCGTMTPPPPVDLTPPPPSHATPPPPNIANYHKFYQTNVPSSSGRNSRPVHQMSPAPPSGRTNVAALNPNLMAQYSSSFNGYRVPGQQSPATVTGYITNTGFINQTQIPMQMMNMQGQYGQDPQQNTMYTYGYLNGSLMQPLNSTMRR